MAASAKSRRACGPSFVFLARPRSCDALKSPRNATGIAMTNLHRSPPLNQSKIDLGIVNESQLLRLGIIDRSRNSDVNCFTSQENVMHRPDPASGPNPGRCPNQGVPAPYQ